MNTTIKHFPWHIKDIFLMLDYAVTYSRYAYLIYMVCWKSGRSYILDITDRSFILDISSSSYILDIQVGKIVSPNSLPGRGGRISGVRLHSVPLHLLSKQHPHLTATRWVHSQILGKKISQVLSHITASYCPTSYLVHTVYGDLNLHKGC